MKSYLQKLRRVLKPPYQASHLVHLAFARELVGMSITWRTWWWSAYRISTADAGRWTSSGGAWTWSRLKQADPSSSRMVWSLDSLGGDDTGRSPRGLLGNRYISCCSAEQPFCYALSMRPSWRISRALWLPWSNPHHDWVDSSSLLHCMMKLKIINLKRMHSPIQLFMLGIQQRFEQRHVPRERFTRSCKWSNRLNWSWKKKTNGDPVQFTHKDLKRRTSFAVMTGLSPTKMVPSATK